MSTHQIVRTVGDDGIVEEYFIEEDGSMTFTKSKRDFPHSDEDISNMVAKVIGAVYGKDFDIPGELLVATGDMSQEHFDLLKVGVQGTEGIEAQELEGQAELMYGTEFPIDCDLSLDQLSRLGFKIGENIDRVFRECSLPTGWEIVPTSHSMWNDVLDGNGIKRASMFYKASFYDRSAHVHFNSRYFVEKKHEGDTPEVSYKERKRLPVSYVVTDRQTGKELYTTAVVTPQEGDEPWDIDDMLRPEADNWLNENYALHKDSLAYWD